MPLGSARTYAITYPKPHSNREGPLLDLLGLDGLGIHVVCEVSGAGSSQGF